MKTKKKFKPAHLTRSMIISAAWADTAKKLRKIDSDRRKLLKSGRAFTRQEFYEGEMALWREKLSAILPK